MIAYVDQVIVSGQPSKDSITNLLYSSGVGKHTSIVYINRSLDGSGKAAANTNRYIWEHKFQRPHTFSFPIACPLCAHVYPWQAVPGQLAAEAPSFELACKTKLENGQKCKGKWVVPERPVSSVVPSPYVGTWRAM
jgi:hypothetical protein